jgi:hypothetical protein
VLTLDSDFSIYRKHGSQPLTLIEPEAGQPLAPNPSPRDPPR